MVENPTGSPSYTTSYSYDVLDNLTGVNQGGQTRSFQYDSLKRLVQAFNPESGNVNYTYDPNGNLTTKTDAANRITCFGVLNGGTCDSSSGYDAFNRPLRKSYSDGTPTVNYAYDAGVTIAGHTEANYPVGRLTSVSSAGVSQTDHRYDPLGRVASSQQTTGGPPYIFGYQYNRAGALTAITYPSSRAISVAYDLAGRATAVNKAAGGSYVSGIQYYPHGAIQQMTLGNNLVESTGFNRRLQPTSIALGAVLSLGFGYYETDSTKNNGNLWSETISGVGGTFSQNYTYDDFNRLTNSSERPPQVAPGHLGATGIRPHLNPPGNLSTGGTARRPSKVLREVSCEHPFAR